MLLRILLLLLLLLSQQGYAVDVKGLYEIEVLAMSQSAVDREIAIQHALKDVLGRIIIGDDLDKDPIVKQVLANANVYVREYQYALATPEAHATGEERMMRILFDEQKLQEQLKHSTLGFWNEIRPETLIWLVVEEQGQQQLFTADKMPVLQEVLQQKAKQQGIPILLPLMDMEEQTQLSIREVLSPYPQPLLALSARYDVVSIMVGLLVNDNGCWRTEWTHYFDQQVRQWHGDCKPLKQAVMVGLQGTYKGLSAYYGVKPASQFVRKGLMPIETLHHHS